MDEAACWEGIGRAARGDIGCCVGGVAGRGIGRHRDVGWTQKWNNALLDQGRVGGCGLAMGRCGRSVGQDCGRKAVRVVVNRTRDKMLVDNYVK